MKRAISITAKGLVIDLPNRDVFVVQEATRLHELQCHIPDCSVIENFIESMLPRAGTGVQREPMPRSGGP